MLALSERTLGKLREFAGETNRDYRNVLYWSEFSRGGAGVRLALDQRLADVGQPPSKRRQ
jgi:hypothetical protein